MALPKIPISLFNYNLPDEKIAKYPLANRDESKLLIYNHGTISESIFNNIANLIPTDSILYFNNTKVIQARLQFKKSTGALIEIFCLEPTENRDYQQVFAETEKTSWKCIVGNSKKWKDGELEMNIEIDKQLIILKASRKALKTDTSIIEFTWNNNSYSFGEIIETIGKTPIPPYLNRPSEQIDTHRYQTVYSQHKGSVAAPTAGLHFTPEILQALNQKNIQTRYITLHVGAGTFKPVKSETIDQHEMHDELFSISVDEIKYLSELDSKLIAVGTTTVRTLESLYWLGVKISLGQSPNKLNQTEAYELPQKIMLKEALVEIINYLTKNNVTQLVAQTSIMIAPGYQFKIVKGLVTNFHQPQSTLLLLISALIGDKWKDVYDYALNNQFRFLSYGDSSLLLP